MAGYTSVGKRIPRVDSPDKVTGAAVYSADIVLPHMLHARVLRSPHAHALIRRLDISRAQALNGVMAVITAADVPVYKDKAEPVLAETPHLAGTKVVYDGQPVAAVAAINPSIAREALGLVEVDYKEIHPLFDVQEAMKPDAPLIYPGLHAQHPGGEDPVPGNIPWRVEYTRGDVDRGFKEADLILENTFITRTVHQGYMEPMAAVASTDVNGKVTVWTQSQGIFQVRELLAEFLNLPLSHINVVPVEIGGAFGGKTYQLLSPLCALLSLKTGRPVKMVMTREEVIRASRPAPASVITVKLGVTKQGLMTAASAFMIFDEGAFPERPYALNAAVHGLGHYKIPNLKIEAFDVLTNKVPSGSYRAPSAPQAAFAVESQVDLIARAMDMDPLQLRIINLAEEGDPMPDGTIFPRVGFKETMQKMAEHLAGKGKIEGENRGRGIACSYWRGGVGCSSAQVNLNADGTINLVLGSTDLTGSRTSLAQIVAEEFSIPFQRVSVVTGDTDTAPYSDLAVGSRTTYQMGMAVYRACQDAKIKLAGQAALRLNVEAVRLELDQGYFQVKENPDRCVSIAELARNSIKMKGEGPIIGHGSVGTPPYAPMFAVHAADVQVDKETGKVKILSYAAAQDVGRAINPALVEGQIQGAVAQGIGWALTEQYVFESGKVQNTTLLDYKMPTALDVPFIDVLLVEIGSDAGPYGIRPVGEPPMIPALACIANAVHSAAGIRLRELPMSPEAVFRALQSS